VLEARCSQGPISYRVCSNSINGKKGKVIMEKKRRGEGLRLNSTPLVFVSWICFIIGQLFASDVILRFILLSVARVLPQAFHSFLHPTQSLLMTSKWKCRKQLKLGIYSDKPFAWWNSTWCQFHEDS